MAQVGRAYHPEARLPESEAELEPLYRSVLHRQRALLLVTSRAHFALPGLVALDLVCRIEGRRARWRSGRGGLLPDHGIDGPIVPWLHAPA